MSEFKKTPYDDDDLVYNYKTHKYELTLKGMLNRTGIDLLEEYGSEYEANKKIKKASDQIYRFIYSCKFPHQVHYTEFLLAKYEEYREAILEALTGQIEYDVESGGMSVEEQHGLDMLSASTRVIEGKIFREQMRISQKSIDVLNQYGLLFSNYTNPLRQANIKYREDY